MLEILYICLPTTCKPVDEAIYMYVCTMFGLNVIFSTKIVTVCMIIVVQSSCSHLPFLSQHKVSRTAANQYHALILWLQAKKAISAIKCCGPDRCTHISSTQVRTQHIKDSASLAEYYVLHDIMHIQKLTTDTGIVFPWRTPHNSHMHTNNKHNLEQKKENIQVMIPIYIQWYTSTENID